MNGKTRGIAIVIIALMALCFTSVSYAQRGTITGRVTDYQTGDYLPGANIMLKGTSMGAASDREGLYKITNVPPGKYTLIAKYIGYKDYSTDVLVVPGKSTVVNIKLKVSYVQMKDIVVSGLRQGQVKALALQKQAISIKNVVSKEQMENFPDVNVAEVLGRLPGVMIDRSQGDGRYVLIRGTDPRLSSVTVNGAPLATTRNEERYSQLDIIGSNQMAFVEVVKALTPDMDANSIGGTVNIITPSAFDYPGRKMDISVGSGYSELDKAMNWEGKFNYSNKFGAHKDFGLSVTANYSRKNRGADNIESEWDEEKTETGKIVPFALADTRLMDYQLIKSRYGIGGSLEYRPNKNNRIYTNLMWNKYVDETADNRFRLRVNKGDYLNDDATLTQKSRIRREDKGRTENLIQSDYTFGGEHNFGGIQLDYKVAYSYGEETHPNELNSEWDFDNKVNLRLDLSDPVYPKWDILNIDPDLQNQGAHFEFGDFDYRETFSSSANTVGGINLKMPYSLVGYPANVKFGLKYTNISKDRNDNRYKYKWKGSGNPVLSDFLSDRVRNDFMNGHYHFGQEADHQKLMDWFKKYKDKADGFVGEKDYEDSDAASYTVAEDVLAYYAMTDVTFGDLKIIGGFRHEFTKDKSTGHKLVLNGHGDFSSLEKVTNTKKYNNLFPMLHFRYNVSNNTQLRLAFTQSLSRPNYWDLAPHRTIDYKHERIRSGNPDLVPTTATNIDFMGQHYLQGVGIASFGFFYKSLKNIIYESRRELTSGPNVGFDLEQTINGGDASLYGIEVNWQEELTFLPGFLSGLGVYINYTHTWSDADLLGRKGYIPGQAGDIANISLGYELKGFTARLSYNYQGKYINEVGKDKDHDYYRNSHGQLDFTASKDLFGGMKLFFEGVNLTNAPKYEYIGNKDHPTQVEFFSWWTRFGIRYNLD